MYELKRFIRARSLILQWFKANKDNHFFRQNRNPYRVWVSEVILQQTRINSAINKMEYFLKVFPDLQALAAASEDEVLEAFKGLGYYNRARQLRKGAIELSGIDNFFQGNYEELLKIPSIGPYTAAAISSICFNRPIPVIDGNIKRILSRIFLVNGTIGSKEFEERIKEITGYFFLDSIEKTGTVNEGLMEFGQKICIAGMPRCSNCIINPLCIAFKKGKVESYPEVKRKSFKNVEWNVYFVRKNGKFAVQKYTDFPFLKNQTGFLSVLKFSDSNQDIYSHNFLKKINLNDKLEFIKGPKHNITDNKIQFFYTVIDYAELNKTGITEPGIDFIESSMVEKLLVSSGLLKLWKCSL